MIYKAYVNVSRDSVETNDYITFRNCGWSDNMRINARTLTPMKVTLTLPLSLSSTDLIILPTHRKINPQKRKAAQSGR